MGRVAGKRVLITGAAGGLGQAMARMLAREGATVAVTDVNADGVRALADEINAERAGAAFAYAHDVADEDQWAEVVARAVADMGGLSVLVNNAGVGGPLTFVEADTAEAVQEAATRAAVPFERVLATVADRTTDETKENHT